jgi:hypothetical protein
MMRLLPPFFFTATFVGGALLRTAWALLRREWLSVGESACILLIAVAWARALPEPTHTFRNHARRALHTAGLFAGMFTLMSAGSLVAPPLHGNQPISAMLVVFVFFVVPVLGAVFGGASYLAMTALVAAWDAAVPGIKGRLRGHR